MDAFEQYVQRFSSTIYGSEMKSTLVDCFNLITAEIRYHTYKISEAESKIKKLEGGN